MCIFVDCLHQKTVLKDYFIVSNKSLIVFGEALVDLFRNGAVVGGAPFNVARHLAGFGKNPLFISAIGKDNAADLILQEVSRYGLSSTGLQILTNQRTGVVQVHENAQGHQFEIMPDCAYDAIETTAALTSLEAFTQTNQQATMFYHGTLGLRGGESFKTFEAVSNVFKKTASANIYLDINWRAGHVDQSVAMQCLREANIIKVSIEELQMVLSWFKVLITCENKPPKTNDIERPIQHLMAQMKAHLLLVTYGDLGSAAFNREGLCLASAPVTKCLKVVDTVGAGDAFSSVMLIALTQNWQIGLALQRANQFASDICGIRGATPIDLTFYQKYVTAWKE